MKTIIKNWKKQYGYEPSIYEIIDAYRNGELQLTDKQENEILKIIDKYE